MRGFAPVCFKNFRVHVVMLVMMVKPADISSLECVSTYFPTGLRTFFRLLQSSESCRTSCTPDCFQILDSATTKYQVKLKESMFIKWEKPDLNQQVKHINLTLSL